MDRRHWSLLAIAALLIGVLSLFFVEVDLDLDDSLGPAANPEAKAVSTELGD